MTKLLPQAQGGAGLGADDLVALAHGLGEVFHAVGQVPAGRLDVAVDDGGQRRRPLVRQDDLDPIVTQDIHDGETQARGR